MKPSIRFDIRILTNAMISFSDFSGSFKKFNEAFQVQRCFRKSALDPPEKNLGAQGRRRST